VEVTDFPNSLAYCKKELSAAVLSLIVQALKSFRGYCIAYC
jgi:hypothetical protein